MAIPSDIHKPHENAAPGKAGVEQPLHIRTPLENRKERVERIMRAGVFTSVPKVDRVIDRLLQAGFDPEEINVICSEQTVQDHFRQFVHQQPAGTHTPAAAAAGSVIGAAIGGVVAIAGMVTTGGVGVLASAGIAAWSGGVVGGLIGAMMTRGVEKELANFYDQAVTQGKILVAVDSHAEKKSFAQLHLAEVIFNEEGAEPMSLPEG